MKKLILTSLSAILLATSAQAGGYVSGSFGTGTDTEATVVGASADNKVEFGDILNLNVAVGYKFDNNVRLEADIASIGLLDKTKADADQTEQSFSLGLGQVRALYDFSASSGFTPYLGLGLDNLSWNEDGNESLKLDVAGIVGVAYALNTNLALDIQYQRSLMGYDTMGENIDTSSDWVNIFKLGLKYNF